MCPYMHDGGSGWWMVFGMILFWIVVFVALYLLYRALIQGKTAAPAVGPTPTETPHAILDRRLAAGEISPDDYDALRQKLES